MIRAPRVHHAARRRSDSMAAGGRAQQPERRPIIGFLGDRFVSGMDPVDCRFCPATGRAWMDRRPQRDNRVSLGGGTRR